MASLDVIFDLLSEERRRYALYYLEQQNGAVRVDDVVEQVLAWESDPDHATIPGERYNGLKIELMHNDLPRAAELEYIEFDREAQTVEVTGDSPDYRAILTIAKHIERPG